MVKHKGFQSLLYYKFITEKAFRVEEVARGLGISPATLYNYIEGRSTFPPDLLAQLFNLTGEREFLNFIVNDTPVRLVERNGAKATRGVLDETLDVSVAVGQLTGHVQKALADGHISELEARR